MKTQQTQQTTAETTATATAPEAPETMTGDAIVAQAESIATAPLASIVVEAKVAARFLTGRKLKRLTAELNARLAPPKSN